MRHRSLGDGRGRSRLRRLGLAVLVLLAGRSAGAVEPAAPDDAFVSDHCTSCHNDVSRKGQLDLTGLEFDASDPANLAVWIKVHDRVKAGEMPPRGKARPDAARQKAFVEGLAQSIVAAERAALAGEGRAIRRRLNRHEYENALRDLLGVPWAQVASRLPEDGEAYRFNKSGEALDVSYLQMARFMDSADYAMRLAMATDLERPAKTTRKLYARDEPSLRNWWPRENGTLPDRLSFPVLDSHAQPDVRAGRAPATSPETREREAVGKVSSIFSDAGRLQLERLAGAGRGPLQAADRRLHDLGRRRRGGALVLRGPGGREGAGLSHAPVAPPEPGRSLARPAQRADRRLRARRRPDPPGRGRRFHAEADRERDRGLPAGRRGRADRRLAPLPHAGQRHRRAVRQSRWRPRTACRATPSSGSRSKARSTTTRPAERAIELLFDDLPLAPLGAGADAACRWRSARRPVGRPGGGRRRAAAGRAVRRGRARGALSKSNPRRRGRTPSGCCDRS